MPNISIPDNSQDINKSFSLKELERALSHQKNSSPGHDKISLQSINHLPIKAINLVLKSFNDSWSSSQIPKDWTRAIILPFIKPQKNPKEVSSYRPISLTSVIAKLLERMILHRMLDFSFQNKIFHVNHHGFYPHRSSINTLLQLQHDIILTRERKEYFILVALDIKAAYDSVWPNGLISKLNKVGYSGRLLRWTQNFLHQRTMKIKWRNFFKNRYKQLWHTPGLYLKSFPFYDLYRAKLGGKHLLNDGDMRDRSDSHLLFQRNCLQEKSTPCSKLVMRIVYGRDLCNAAMKYGLANEEIARKQYEREYSTEVKKYVAYLWTKINPFLCASPDGLVGDDGLIEIKCPYSARFESNLLEFLITKKK
ncbi:probable RNA-directed DNA polymerase from transposon BS [Trichonephila clavipes]|nr:probable RNA-directed DNA polymerase from transposon BS [Trichonephila clavipes]